ncbi:MAG TPA: PAS domain-containing protein [Acidobacteriaceae bacterium]|nr:PAS domain-containing protein [Acidobacteriaceae bacterium]
MAIGALAVALTDWIVPLHSFPLLLAFPVVLLVCWYLGMASGTVCALTETALVDIFLTRTRFHLSVGSAREEARLAMFLAVSVLLGWAMRRLAQQRAQLATQGLERELQSAHAERELAEERVRAAVVLRERDDLLQIALRANGMGLWAWDLVTGTVQWSDEVYRIAGLKPGDIRASIDDWVDLIHPDDAARVRTAVERTHTTGAEYRQQYRVRLRDGSERWVESQGRCQRDSQGHPRRVVGVMADITGRKRAEEAMLRAEKLAVAGRLAASIAHEINNPLEAIANLLYLIATDKPEADKGHLAQQALDEVMRVSLITQQTLKFHRQTGPRKSTQLAEILQTVLALFRGRLQGSGIEVDLRAPETLQISCMPGEVQQVFANLVSNAIDAMAKGGRLIIRLRFSRDWRDYSTPGVRATFVDNGCGMDDVTRHRIFEPFFTTKADTGTGLGMWVVAQLVEQHGGSIHVWSRQRSESGITAISVFLPSGANPQTAALATNEMQAQLH